MKNSCPSFTYRIGTYIVSLVLCLLTFMPFAVGAQTSFPSVIPFVGATGTATTPQTQTQTSAPKPQPSAVTSQTVRKAQTPRTTPTTQPTPSYINSTIEQALQSFRIEYNNKLQTLTTSIQNTPTYSGGGYSRSVDAVGQSAIDTSITSLSTSIQNNATLRNTLLLNATVSGLFSGSATLTDSVLNGSLYLSDISAPSITTNRLYALGGEIYFNGSPIASAGADSWTESGSDVYRASGKVGIGTTNPTTALEVVGDITSKGTEWTLRTSAGIGQWGSVTYGNGRFVAIGTSQSVGYSSDGINWNSRYIDYVDFGTSPNQITYGNGLFVIVGSGGMNNPVATSPDGITWTERASASNNQWKAITYGNGLFVALSDTGTGNRVMTSPDGINWTSRTSAADNFWKSITYGNGLFVAVSENASGSDVMTSPDGITWTLRSTPPALFWQSVTYGNGLFVAVANGGGVGNRVMTSPDGVTWTSRTSAADNQWRSVTYGNGLFVAVARSGTGNRVMTSPDGINWVTRSSAANNPWVSVTYGNGMFVAVANGTIMTSGKTETNALATNNLYQGGLTLMSGNMGIGTSTSASRLAVSGSIMSTTLLGGATTLSTDANGNIIRTPSDATLKTDVHTIETALEKVQKLRGVSYNWIDQEKFGTSTEIGLIAQEVELVVPEVVKSGGAYKSVNYQNLVALLIEAIKELSTSVTSIASWFTDQTLTIAKERFLNIEGTATFTGTICADDVCITKDQFKSLLLQQGGTTYVPAPAPEPETPTEPEQAPTGESVPTSDEVTSDASVSSEEPTLDSAPEQTPVSEQTPEQVPAPEAPAPEAPAPVPASE